MTHGALREYGPLRLMHGCAPRDEYCSGPEGAYWTLFDSELVMLLPHALGAMLLGALVSGLVWRRSRAAQHRASAAKSAGAGIFTACLSFLLLAWAMPVDILY